MPKIKSSIDIVMHLFEKNFKISWSNNSFKLVISTEWYSSTGKQSTIWKVD